MDQKPEDNWFYSQNGQRNGPVPLAELQQLVASGALDPLSDLAWQPGMPGWKSIGEIVELFKKSDHSQATETPTVRATAEPKPKPEPRPEPKPEPARSSSSKAGAFEPMESYDDPEDKKPKEPYPGAGRFGYIFFKIIFPIIACAGAGIAAEMIKKDQPETAQLLIAGALLLSALLSLIFFLRRLTNLGMSWWWFFGAFVPFLNLWIGYRCFACPAEYAENQKLDGIGIFLAIIYWLFLLLIIVAVVFTIMAVAAAAVEPGGKGQLQELLRSLQALLPPPTPAK